MAPTVPGIEIGNAMETSRVVLSQLANRQFDMLSSRDNLVGVKTVNGAIYVNLEI